MPKRLVEITIKDGKKGIKIPCYSNLDNSRGKV